MYRGNSQQMGGVHYYLLRIPKGTLKIDPYITLVRKSGFFGRRGGGS